MRLARRPFVIGDERRRVSCPIRLRHWAHPSKMGLRHGGSRKNSGEPMQSHSRFEGLVIARKEAHGMLLP